MGANTNNNCTHQSTLHNPSPLHLLTMAQPTAVNILGYVTNENTAEPFGNLVKAVQFADNSKDIQAALDTNRRTLWAPSNTKFTEAPKQYRWSSKLTEELLKNHVSKEVFTPTTANQDIDTLFEETIKAKSDKVGDNIKAESVGETTNIYKIDGFLVPGAHATYGKQTLGEIASDNLATTDVTLSEYAVGEFYTNTLQQLTDESNTAPLFGDQLGYTVFLPSKDAFQGLVNDVKDKKGVTEYLNDKGLERALKAHIVKGGSAVEGGKYTNIVEGSIEVYVEEKKVTIGGVNATVELTPTYAKNGQAHVIDKVLSFPRKTIVEIAGSNSDTQVLAQLLKDNELLTALEDVTKSTVFAPTNNALNPVKCFQEWGKDIVNLDNKGDNMKKLLKHHVLNKRVFASDLPTKDEEEVGEDLNGDKVLRKEIRPATVDVLATNGNIHIVNKVLLPKIDDLPIGTVVDIAGGSGTTSKLAEYVGFVPDVVKVLNECRKDDNGYTAYTVFAPTDTAFASLTQKDIAYLQANNYAKLIEVLENHVVLVPKKASDLTGELKSLHGDTLVVKEKDDDKYIGAAKISGKDNKALNGYVHVIDEVLIPSSVKLPSQNSAATTSLSAISVAVMGIFSYFVAAF